MPVSTVATFGARASDASPTRRWLRRRVIGAVVGIVVGIGLVVAGGVVRATSSQPVEVGPNTRRAVATITGFRYLPNGRLGSTEELTVAFHSDDGVARSAEIDIGIPKPQYAKGMSVPVVYDPLDPSTPLLEGVPLNPPIPWVVPTGLGVTGIVVGALLLTRTRGTARILRDNPWVIAGATVVQASVGQGLRTRALFLELTGAPDPETVLAGPISARVAPEMVPAAWVAGSDRRFVVGAVGGAPLVALHRARLRPAGIRPAGRRPPTATVALTVRPTRSPRRRPATVPRSPPSADLGARQLVAESGHRHVVRCRRAAISVASRSATTFERGNLLLRVAQQPPQRRRRPRRRASRRGGRRSPARRGRRRRRRRR